MFGFYEDPEVSRAYLVLENAGEKTLRDFIDEKKPEGPGGARLQVGTVREIMTQLFRATGYLHENNVCHRDLKPDNVMVSNAVNNAT